MSHSGISGSKVTCTSPEHFVACHALHHHSEPSHPPNSVLILNPMHGFMIFNPWAMFWKHDLHSLVKQVNMNVWDDGPAVPSGSIRIYMDPSGFEPDASSSLSCCVQGRRSTRLSYGPTQWLWKNSLVEKWTCKLKSKKEVIQPQVPLRLPCDDLTLLAELRFDLIKN